MIEQLLDIARRFMQEPPLPWQPLKPSPEDAERGRFRMLSKQLWEELDKLSEAEREQMLADMWQEMHGATQ